VVSFAPVAAKPPAQQIAVAQRSLKRHDTMFDDAEDEVEDDDALACIASMKISDTPFKTSKTPGKKEKSKPKTETVADLREQCKELGLKEEGSRYVLAARRAWAKVPLIELRVICADAGVEMGEDLSATVEKLVRKQQKGEILPPAPENVPVQTKPLKPVPAYMLGGAFSRSIDCHDSRRTYFIARAKSDRSSCVHCQKNLKEGEWRIGKNDKSGFTSWYHPECFVAAFGKGADAFYSDSAIIDLLRELETSNGRWNLFEQRVLNASTKAKPRYRAVKALKAGFLKTPMRGKSVKKPKKALWDSDDEGDGLLEEVPARQ
jgi:hypothetical protein